MGDSLKPLLVLLLYYFTALFSGEQYSLCAEARRFVQILSSRMYLKYSVILCELCGGAAKREGWPPLKYWCPIPTGPPLRRLLYILSS